MYRPGFSGIVVFGKNPQHVYRDRIDQQDDVGIDEVDAQRHPAKGPLVRFAHLVDDVHEAAACEHHPVVKTEDVVRLQIAVIFGRQRVSVQHVEVIVLAERVDGELPVDVGADQLRGAISMLRQVPLRHVVHKPAELLRDIDLPAGGRLDPQHAGVFRARQFDQSSTGLVDDPERRFAVDGEKFARVAIRPRVIGTGEPRPFAAAVGDHLRAAVAADVGESAKTPAVAARHQDRQARLAVRPVAALLRQIRGQAHQ